MEVSVSVIIPTRNRCNLLAKAIKSVLNQTYQDFEIIVIDDASNDDTIEMLNKVRRLEKRLTIISNKKPMGGAESRNIGISVSNGKWIAFLDDDDSWFPQKLAKQLQALAHKPKAIACSCAYQVNYPLGVKRIITPPSVVSMDQLLQANILGGASVCITSSQILKQMGGLDKKLRSSQDWDLWLRLLEKGEIISVNEPLVKYQIHFNVRISNDMHAKYDGARRFYNKYKNKMNDSARIANLAFICFIQSREKRRKLNARFKKLLIAIKYSSKKEAAKFLISSVPRMII